MADQDPYLALNAERPGALVGQVNTARRSLLGLEQLGKFADVVAESDLLPRVERLIAEKRARGAEVTQDELDYLDMLRRENPKVVARDLAKVGELQRDIQAIPESADVQEYNDARGFLSKMGVVAKNPVEIPTNIMVRGAVTSLPAIALGAAGTAALGPAGGALGTGAGSFGVEVTSSLMDSFNEAGIDFNDPRAFAAAVNSPEIMDAARNRAVARGVPIAVFDALSAGLAGRFLSGAKEAGTSMVRAAAKETATQGLFGGAGEAAGGLASGEGIDPTAVFEEVIGEVVPGSREVVQNYIQERRTQQASLAEAAQVLAPELRNLQLAQDAAQEAQVQTVQATISELDNAVSIALQTEGSSDSETTAAAQRAIADASRQANVARQEADQQAKDAEQLTAQSLANLQQITQEAQAQAQEQVSPDAETALPAERTVEPSAATLPAAPLPQTEEVAPTRVSGPIELAAPQTAQESRVAPVERLIPDYFGLGPAVTLTQPIPELNKPAGDTVLVSQLTNVGYVMPDIVPEGPRRTIAVDAQGRATVVEQPQAPLPLSGAVAQTPASNTIPERGSAGQNVPAPETLSEANSGASLIQNLQTEQGLPVQPATIQTTEVPSGLQEGQGQASQIAQTSDTLVTPPGGVSEVSDVQPSSQFANSEQPPAVASEVTPTSNQPSPTSENAGRVVDIDDDAAIEEEAQKQQQSQLPDEPATIVEPTAPEGQKVRNLARRVINDEDMPADVRRGLARRPEIFYDVFSLGALRLRARSATEQELAAMRGDPDPLVHAAAVIEMGNRATRAGEHEAAAQLYAEASTLFTDAAQLLNVAKHLESPQAIIRAIAKAVDEATNGQRQLPQDPELDSLAKEKVEADLALEDAAEKARNDYSEENQKAYEEARKRAGEAASRLAKKVNAYVPKSWGDIISTIMKLNLIVVKSLAVNVFGNLAYHPMRRGALSIASLIDAAITHATGRPRTVMQSSPLPTRDEIAGFNRGAQAAAGEVITGPTPESYVRLEAQAGFRPITAFIQAITGKGLPLDANGQPSLNDRAKKFVEGILGAHSEVIARLLTLGDKPFRYAEEARFLNEQANLRGLTGREREQFLAFPPVDVQMRLMNEGRRAIFAQENKALPKLNWLLDKSVVELTGLSRFQWAKDANKILGTMIVPFRQFPINFVSNVMDYALPPVALAKSVYFAAKGDRRSAQIAIGEMMVGLMIYAAADWLWDKELISEGGDADDEKQRSIQYERMGPSRLNVSGLERALKCGDPRWQRDDLTIDWTKYGVAGSIFYIRSFQNARDAAKFGRTGTPQNRADSGTSASGIVDDMMASFPGLSSFTFNQSFLSGTRDFLEAIKDTDPNSPAWKRWVEGAFRQASGVVLPNNIDQVAKSEYKYVHQMKGDTLADSFKRLLEFKTLQLDDDSRTGFRRDLWGEKIERTPPNANPYFYQMLDVQNASRKSPDEFKQRLSDLFAGTLAAEVYPTPPTRNVTDRKGATHRLTLDDFELLQESVGRERRAMAERLVMSPDWNNHTANEKVFLLSQIYSKAGEIARTKFIRSPEFSTRYLGDAESVIKVSPKGRIMDERSSGSDPYLDLNNDPYLQLNGR